MIRSKHCVSMCNHLFGNGMLSALPRDVPRRKLKQHFVINKKDCNCGLCKLETSYHAASWLPETDQRGKEAVHIISLQMPIALSQKRAQNQADRCSTLQDTSVALPLPLPARLWLACSGWLCRVLTRRLVLAVLCIHADAHSAELVSQPTCNIEI